MQLGDVHYGTHAGDLDADLKDKGFPEGLHAKVVRGRLPAVLRAAVKVRAELDPVIVLCGDLRDGWSKNPDEYAACVRFLDDLLRLKDPSVTPPERLHVVPGNHDLDRGLASDSKPLARFQAAAAAWAPLDVLPLAGPRSSAVSDGVCGVSVTSVNSCVGGGDRRAYPQEVLDRIAALGAEGAALSAELDREGEQLDIPAFDEEHLAELVGRLEVLAPDLLPVVLAHHNMLPQATPRLVAYGESVNAGAARTRLTDLGRAVLYLHGHTHTDTIDLVRQLHPGGGALLAVAAPELSEGFNLVSVVFNDSGRLLGIQVVQYRARGEGSVRRHVPIRVPLPDERGEPHPLLHNLRRLLPAGTNMRFREVSDLLTSNGVTHDDAGLADALLEAEWRGFVQAIADRDSEPRFWTMRTEAA